MQLHLICAVMIKEFMQLHLLVDVFNAVALVLTHATALEMQSQNTCSYNSYDCDCQYDNNNMNCDCHS